MAALTNAVQPAIPSWSDAQTVAGSVATPLYPGPITGDHSGGPETRAPGSTAGPIPGTATIGYFERKPVFEDIPGSAGNTGSDDYGHAGVISEFDSNAGEPFAQGLGPIADTHGFDTGGTTRKEYVLDPDASGWYRRTNTGEAMDHGVTYDETGKIVTHPNGRINYDQYQGHNADGYDPKVIPYSERPIKLNVAHEPVNHNSGNTTPYEPQSQLSPVGPQFWTNTSNIYEAPPDPSASISPEPDSAITPTLRFWR